MIKSKPENQNPASQNHKAEKWSYKPANRKKRAKLISIVCQNILIAHGHAPEASRIEPVGQLEEFIDRISRRAGAQTPLYEIQGDPTGKGFISQVPPRKHEAEHRYGFQFGHAQEQEKSWWWILLGDGGMEPLLTDVELAPENNGTPKAQVAPEPKPPRAETLKGHQSDLFNMGSGPGAIAL